MPEEQENYSRDADQTRFVMLAGILAIGTVVIWFILEMAAMIMFKVIATGEEAKSTYQPFIFTSEIVHALIPVTVGILMGIGGFLFGREVGKQMRQNQNGRSQ